MASRPSLIVSSEMLQQVSKKAEFSASFVVLMAMAGVLAAVALLTNSVPVLIGAMVIAPAFGPLALISVALVSRKPRLAFHGLWVAIGGLLIATGCAMLTTWIMNVTNVMPLEANLLNKPLLEERVHPGWYSVVAAIAGGVAGMIAISKQKTDTEVGVVAALALVPAAAAGGIALLSHHPAHSLGGFGLLGINVGLIVVTGVLTLLIMRPGQQD